MAKQRKSRKKPSIEQDKFLKPIDITKFGTEDDPCFGKLYNLAEPECKRCGDSGLCGIVFGQNLNLKRKEIEKDSKFKDLEEAPKTKQENNSLKEWVKNKKKEGLSRQDVIVKAKKTFGSTRDEIKEIWKKL